MAKNEISAKKKLLNGSLIALLAAAVMTASLAGCGSAPKEKATADEAPATEIVTEEVSGVYVDKDGNIVTEPADQKKTDSKTDKPTDGQTSKSGGSNNANGGNTDSNSNAGSTTNKNINNNSNNNGSKTDGSKTDSSKTNSGSGSGAKGNSERKTTPQNAGDGKTSGKSQEDSAAKDLTIGGKTYKVGDKVVCTYFLEVPENMMNYQGKVTYDSTMLKKTDAYLIEPANYGALMNKDLDGRVVFNGSMLSGYDFSSPGYEFLVVEYEVLKTGVTNPSIDFEVITDVNDKSYAGSNGALSNGANVWAVYS